MNEQKRDEIGRIWDIIENRAGDFFQHEKRESPPKIGRVGMSDIYMQNHHYFNN